MKSRTTWVLLGLAIIVGGVVVWDLRKGTTTEDRERSRKRLVNLKAADVTRVELVRSNQTVVLEKDRDRWQIKQPIVYRAAGSTVDSILNDIELADTDRVLEGKEIEGNKPAEFGLTSPRLRAKLTTRKGVVTLSIGRETPTKEAVYAQVEGAGKIGIVRKNLAERLETSLSDLRDRDVLDTPSTSVTRLEIKAADRLLELAKPTATNTEPRWVIAKPQSLRADQRKVGDLVSDFTGLRVAEFVADDAKDVHPYQLDEPSREVTAYVGDKAKTVQFGKSPTNDATKVFARVKGTDTVFTVAGDIAQKFAVQPNDVRDPQILNFDEAAVRNVQVSRPDTKLELARDTNQVWRITAPKELAADATRVGNLLSKLKELTATQFVADVATDLAKLGLATPAATVTLRDGTNTLAQLLVSPPTGTIRNVKRADEPFIYGVAETSMAWLPANELALRSRLVAEIRTNELTSLVIEKGGKTTGVEKDKDGKWKLAQPPQGVLDNDSLNQVLQSLNRIEAAEFVSEGIANAAEYGLDKPELKLTVTVAGKPYVLQTGKKTPTGDQYVSWSEPAFIFTVPGYALTALGFDLVTTPPPANTNTNPPPPVVSPAK